MRQTGLPPTTEAVYIDYKEPLRKVKDGYGFQGVVCANKEKTHIQCHICGYFFMSLAQHVSKKHKISTKDYRVKYQLAMKNSLLAPATRVRKIQAIENSDSLSKLQRLCNLKAGWERKVRKRHQRGELNNSRPKSLEAKNKEGRCPDQLLQKISGLSENLGKTPSAQQFRDYYGHSYLINIQRTFGSWSNAINLVNLSPNRAGGKFVYTKDILITMLQDFYRQYGRKPVTSDFDKGMLPQRRTYTNHFGDMGQALQLAFNNYDFEGGASDWLEIETPLVLERRSDAPNI